MVMHFTGSDEGEACNLQWYGELKFSVHAVSGVGM